MEAVSTRILAIETSCDETAAAVVEDGRVVLANVVASQVDLHAEFGGVFPELASRQHVRDVTRVVQSALERSGLGWSDLAAVAVTRGPGLSGALLVGVNAAKGIALACGLPLIGVNHLEGHLYANWLHVNGTVRTSTSEPWSPADDPRFPYLALIVSGGHTELIRVEGHGRYELLGATLDDAAGEAFDKAGRMLGLEYPGGPAIERAAAEGDPERFAFPVAATREPYDFSFSGVKTAVLRVVEEAAASGRPLQTADIAASFQAAVVRALSDRVARALRQQSVRSLLVAGGVAANLSLRRSLADVAEVPVRFPPLELCTDNAAMIAAAAHWRDPGSSDAMSMDVDAGLGLTPR